MMRVSSPVTRIAVVLTLILAWPVAATAQATPGSRVLVMPFEASVDTAAPGGAGAALWMGEAASILLGERLATLGVGTLTRSQRVAAFERLNLPMSAALTRATMIRVAEIIGATEVIFGEVTLGREMQVRARLIRLSAGYELPSVGETGTLPDIFALFGRVASALAVHTGRLRPPSAAAATSISLEAFENYVKGLVAATPTAQQRFLETANRLAPGDARIQMALWSVYSAQDLHERALAAASSVPARVPQTRAARFAVALSLIELKRFDGAFQTLTALYNEDRSAVVSNALGVVQLRRPPLPGGNPPTIYFRRAVDEDPENTDYLFNLGYALARSRNTADALTWLREAVRLDAASGEAHVVMSAVLVSAGREPEAQRELELARLLGTEMSLDLQALTAVIPDGLERLPEDATLETGPRLSAAIANPAQRDQRETALFHLSHGKSLIAAERDREAADELRRAIYLAPYEPEPHLMLGQLYHRAGQLPQAIDELKVAIWAQDSAPARLALGRALLDSGDVAAARAEIQRALKLAPNSTEADDLLRRLGG